MVIKTGEIKDYTHHSSRYQNPKAMKRSIAAFRDMVNANCNSQNTLFITLTYADNMTDTKRLYSDFKKFVQKFQRYAEPRSIPYKGYIAACEPQKRGAWHIHLLLIFEPWKPFIPNKDISALWSHGFTKTTDISSCDNVGAYLSAYLSDLAIETDNAPSDNAPKRIIKGARLTMYPTGFHAFRWSRGLAKPIKTTGDYGTLTEKLPVPTYTAHTTIKDQNGEEVNTIWYEHYNTSAL